MTEANVFSDPSILGGIIWRIIGLILAVLHAYSRWKIFEKAGLPGWGSLVPFYNIYLFLKLLEKSIILNIIGLLIPFVNIFVLLSFVDALGDRFGKGFLFKCGLLFIGGVFIPILAFDSSQYIPGDLKANKIDEKNQ